MRSGRKLVALLVALTVLLGLSVSVLAADEITIGFSNWSKRFVFYQELERGILDAAEEYGVKVLVGDPNGDQEKQQSLVENFLVQGVDALILIPIDSKAVVPTIETANAHKVPVVTVDISAAGGDVVTHIASDNRLGGRLAAQLLNELLGGKGKVALINYPVITSTIEREEAFVEELRKYPGLELVAKQTGQSQRDLAMSVTENIMQRHPDLAGIFAVNDMQGLGALAAVEAAGKSDQIVIIGFDAEPEALDAIKAGRAYKGSVAQQPYLLGRMTVEKVLEYLSGAELPASIPVPVEMITAENAQ